MRKPPNYEGPHTNPTRTFAFRRHKCRPCFMFRHTFRIRFCFFCLVRGHFWGHTLIAQPQPFPPRNPTNFYKTNWLSPCSSRRFSSFTILSQRTTINSIVSMASPSIRRLKIGIIRAKDRFWRPARLQQKEMQNGRVTSRSRSASGYYHTVEFFIPSENAEYLPVAAQY